MRDSAINLEGPPSVEALRAGARRERAAWRVGAQWLGRGLLYLTLSVTSVLMAFPLLWMVSTSFKTEAEANAPRLVWLPASPQFDAYAKILADAGFIQAYMNSVFVIVLAAGGADEREGKKQC